MPSTYIGYVSYVYNFWVTQLQVSGHPAIIASDDHRMAIGNSTDVLYHLPMHLIYSTRHRASGAFPSILHEDPSFLFCSCLQRTNADGIVPTCRKNWTSGTPLFRRWLASSTSFLYFT